MDQNQQPVEIITKQDQFVAHPHNSRKYLLIVPILISLTVFLVIGINIFIDNKYRKQPLPVSSMAPRVTTVPTLTTLVIPTTNPILTKDWQTYTDRKLKYTLKYPQKFHAEEWGNCTTFSDLVSPQASAPAVFKKGYSWFDICIVAKDMPDSGYYKNVKETKVVSWQQLSINDYSGFKVSRISNYMQGNQEIICLQNPEGGYAEIVFKAGNLRLFNEILSTFRFVDNNHGKIKIMQENVYYIQEGKGQILVNIKDTPKWDNVTSIAFTDAFLSPDQNKVMLFAMGGITPELLYYVNVKNKSIHFIHTVSLARWSNNSRYIAFTSMIADAGGNYYLGIYDTNLNKNLSLVNKLKVQGIPSYSSIEWQPDDSAIKVHYVAQADIPYGKIVGEGELVIPLTSFAVQQ